jgi:hypothetical protein
MEPHPNSRNLKAIAIHCPRCMYDGNGLDFDLSLSDEAICPECECAFCINDEEDEDEEE